MKRIPLPFAIVLVAGAILAASCFKLNVRLGPPVEERLKEYTIEGTGNLKVLVIPVSGFLSDVPGTGLLASRTSVVQEVVSRLRRAEKDEKVRAVLLEINSPGGAITAADMLYREIGDFKAKTGARVVALFMDVAASGGYYVALPADRIMAHPTSVTGSIGALLLTPKVSGLMGKIGVQVEVSKSGSEKDIGSPFRPSTEKERKIFQDLTDDLGKRFLGLVERHRKIGPESLKRIASARIYLADDALKLGLIDSIGYLEDALKEAKALAGLPQNARVVVYRHAHYADDNLYNTSVTSGSRTALPLVGDIIPPLSPGFYYLWLPAGTGE